MRQLREQQVACKLMQTGEKSSLRLDTEFSRVLGT